MLLNYLLLEKRVYLSNLGLCQGVEGRAGWVEVCVLQKALGTVFSHESAHLSISIKCVMGEEGEGWR